MQNSLTPTERQYYPITSGQMIMFFTQKFSYKKQITNVCASINIESDVDEALLYQSVMLAVMRYPSVNTRITKIDDKLMQYFVNEIPENVKLVDMSSSTQEEIDSAVEKWSSTPFPNKGMDVPLYRVNVIRKPDGKFTLYFCVCHMIMDAYALMCCTVYIGQIYAALRDGASFPQLKTTPMECYQADYSYFTSERYKNDTQWWKEQFTTEPSFTTLNGKNSKDWVKGKKYGVSLRIWKVTADHINLRVPKVLVDRVNEYAVKNRVSPQTAYLLAMRAYLSAVCETEDVMIMNSVARRATLVQKFAGGTMVNAIPLRTTFSNSLSFAESMTQMFKQQREIYRHSDMPCGQILQTIKEKFNLPAGLTNYSYNTVSITYQPFFAYDKSAFKCNFVRHKNGAAASALYISIMPFDDSGDFWVNYEYLTDLVKPESIQAYHAFMLKFFEYGLDDPSLSVEKLIQKSL